jgi:hypothetical protein
MQTLISSGEYSKPQHSVVLGALSRSSLSPGGALLNFGSRKRGEQLGSKGDEYLLDEEWAVMVSVVFFSI